MGKKYVDILLSQGRSGLSSLAHVGRTPTPMPHQSLLRPPPKGGLNLSLPVRIERAVSLLFTRIQRGGWCGLHCAHRATLILLNDPSKLACFSSLGRARMLVYMRPSNEALLRARVPGAQDQRGCPSNPFHRAHSASKKGTWPLPPHPS